MPHRDAEGARCRRTPSSPRRRGPKFARAVELPAELVPPLSWRRRLPEHVRKLTRRCKRIAGQIDAADRRQGDHRRHQRPGAAKAVAGNTGSEIPGRQHAAIGRIAEKSDLVKT